VAPPVRFARAPILSRGAFLRHVTRTLGPHDGRGETASVLLVSLDRFDEVREALGARPAARLVAAAAERVRACLRGPDDAVGRLAEGQLGVFLGGTPDADAMQVGGRVHRALLVPFDGEGRQVRITASLGLVAIRLPLAQSLP
jgi:GGDEF domain-containing protein